jgi:acyl dehydratase
MPAQEITSKEELQSLVGREAGVSDWLEVTQERIDRFADATGDHQWIHVDRDRAKRESPFGATIAHGFLTLSLLAQLRSEAVQIAFPTRMTINYGLNRVRFTAAVPAGSRVRARFTLQSLEERAGALDATWAVTVEREGTTKPCCVAEWVLRYYV